MKDYTKEFQTPPEVCRYMASLLPPDARSILEPTKGIGNIVNALQGYDVTAPEDYFLLDKKLSFDAVVTNPPFSSKYLIMDNAPPNFTDRGMNAGYRILFECMQKAPVIIALMPWFTLSDSDIRLRFLYSFGLKSLTALPRKTFEYARIQTVVLELVKGYQGETTFRPFDFIDPVPSCGYKKQTKIDFDIEAKRSHKNALLF